MSRSELSAVGNILWIFLGGGLILFLEYLLGGFVLCCTIIGIPFGLQQIKLSRLALLPFGKEIVQMNKPDGCLVIGLNILWIVVGGIAITLTHLIFGLLCAITIVGIPFAKQHLKLAGLALTPFGREIR